MSAKKNHDDDAKKLQAEMKVRFEVDELDRFFEGFAPLDNPFDRLLDDSLAAA